jgi:hypothetical protein
MEAYVAVGMVAVPPMMVATALDIVGTLGRYVPDNVTCMLGYSGAGYEGEVTYDTAIDRDCSGSSNCSFPT